MTHNQAPQHFTNDTLAVPLARSAALNRIMSRGTLTVGTSAGIKGMSFYENGTCTGFDADFGRALSAVIFAEEREVTFKVVNPNDRFSALVDTTIDIGLYNASKTMTRELENDVTIPVVTLIDGEGILTGLANQSKTLKSWEAPVIGVQGGTTSPANIAKVRGDQPCDIRQFETLGDAITALKSGVVDAVVFDTIGLAGVLTDMPERNQFTILPERISRELMGPVVPLNDPIFARTVAWMFAALVHASDLGITSDLICSNADALTSAQTDFLKAGFPLWPQDPLAVQRLTSLLIETGNSAELFARNLGDKSDLGITPGLNASTLNGGVFHPAPF
ncbi:transporter substrate-binding domain-containing protein [Pseudovibrio sp. Ad37]|uniref:transporter substrate-binding domain-containing protein n=1 Tax=Pseudovibrio sp. Ad37 TaxID=989422 RepID=UPI0007AEBBFA|nr:transporter substrate-binding domain-containing protein [Pseudovibrio sp. Ad37]KZL20175.1 General L-amino acid-binding periplasmic protein AapJ precursor [Pseudovibrio sp. Ad37]